MKKTLQIVLLALRDRKALVRGGAAEFFRWHGQVVHLNNLERALEAEQDPHTAAVMRSAISTIQSRENYLLRPFRTMRCRAKARWPEYYWIWMAHCLDSKRRNGLYSIIEN